MSLQRWFNGLNRKQLILVRTVTLIIGIPLFLFGGVLIIAIWLYLEFGKDRKK